jgi:hypothetical protein
VEPYMTDYLIDQYPHLLSYWFSGAGRKTHNR